MRVKKIAPILAAIVAVMLIIIAVLIPCSASTAYAAGDGQYDANYERVITQYNATYTFHSDRTVDVEERSTIYYKGPLCTGYYRYLPVNSGDRVYNVSVKQLNRNNDEADVEYSIELENDFIVLDIGDTSNKSGDTVTYIVSYQYAVTNPSSDNILGYNVMQFDDDATVLGGTITINLPQGFLFDDPSTQLYMGGYGDTTPHKDMMQYDSAANRITIDVPYTDRFNGMTVYLTFEDGVLSTRFDFTPYILIIAGCVLLAVLAAVKFLVFPRKQLTPIVNFEAPDGLDPVEISKLIDNKVESADVTTLIFYWASKGYLKIDLADEKNPVLIRINKELPADTPKHQIVLYNALFMRRDMVKVSELEGNFYTNIERVRKLVNEKYRGLYTTKSICASLIFTLLAGLLMALSPIILGLVSINSGLFYYPAFLAVVPAFVIYGVTETYAYSVHKLKKSTKALMIGGIVLLCALFTALYVWLLPSPIMELAPKILVCVIAYAVVIGSVTLISRTKEYTEKLNGIIGFRNFILYTEKDKLEAMLKDDPEYYYKILPYAQVMGVSDIWEDKFRSLTVEPPQWIIDPVGTYVNFAIINRAVRMSSSSLTAKMVSRPNPSSGAYSGGNRFGGSFGGGAGGGHGGGGSRGR